MRKLSILLAFLLGIGTGCHARGNPAANPAPHGDASAQTLPPRAYDDLDAYAVYGALLADSDKAGAPQSRIAIQTETANGRVCSDLSSLIHLSRSQAAKDYAARNSTAQLLKMEDLKIGRNFELIPRSELDSMFSGEPRPGWAKFHKLHPELRGYIELSAVGFSADRDFALVYSAEHCGALCGAGGFITFSKQQGVWRKNSGQLCSWIS